MDEEGISYLFKHEGLISVFFYIAVMNLEKSSKKLM